MKSGSSNHQRNTMLLQTLTAFFVVRDDVRNLSLKVDEWSLGALFLRGEAFCGD